MKKIMLGLAAILATSFAIPAFAEDAPAGDAKPAKKGKKAKKAKDGDTKAPAADGTAK